MVHPTYLHKNACPISTVARQGPTKRNQRAIDWGYLQLVGAILQYPAETVASRFKKPLAKTKSLNREPI